jgi:hypothetical protein
MLGFGALLCFLTVMLMHLLFFLAHVDVTYERVGMPRKDNMSSSLALLRDECLYLPLFVWPFMFAAKSSNAKSASKKLSMTHWPAPVFPRDT